MRALNAKHIWHGLLFLAVALFLLGGYYSVDGSGPNQTADWLVLPAFALLAIGIGLLIWGKDWLSRENIVIEYYDAIVMAVGIALVVRTFIIEPFKIPSGSMIPSLLVGDYLFVAKYAYGFRIPFTSQRLFMGEGPRRGDVMVFKYPLDPAKDYIKRVVGLPGDRIVYREKRLTINGQAISYRPDGLYNYRNEQGMEIESLRYQEKLGEEEHPLLVHPFGFANQSSEVTVPPGHYFVMGDNRDNSNDSRYWGFVPAHQLVGRAIALFWSWDGQEGKLRWERLGQKIR